MAVRQFKELERKDINAPEDKVTVTVRDSQGMTTADGFKEQGETFEAPARQARVMQRGGMVDIGGRGINDEADTRVEAHRAFHDRRKEAENQRRGAGVRSVQGEPETEIGQPGLAEADSGDPAMFSGGQSEALDRIQAQRDDIVEEVNEPASTSDLQGTPNDSPRSPAGLPDQGDQSAEGRQSETEAKANDDYQSKSKRELEQDAKRRELSHSGKSKDELVELLREDDRKKE